MADGRRAFWTAGWIFFVVLAIGALALWHMMLSYGLAISNGEAGASTTEAYGHAGLWLEAMLLASGLAAAFAQAWRRTVAIACLTAFPLLLAGYLAIKIFDL